MKIKEWVGSFGGAVKLAETLGVTRQIVYRWLSGKSLPQKKNLKQLISLSAGTLSAHDFIDHYLNQ